MPCELEQSFRNDCAEVRSKGQRRLIQRALQAWRKYTQYTITRQQLMVRAFGLTSSRRTKSFYVVTLRYWTWYTLNAHALSSRCARLSQGFRRRLLECVMRVLKNHLWEVRVGWRMTRVLSVKRLRELRKTMRVWTDIFSLHKRRRLVVMQATGRKSWRVTCRCLFVWAHHARKAKTLREHACDLGLRVTMRAAGVMFVQWWQSMRRNSYHRLSCKRFADHRMQQYCRSVLVVWWAFVVQQRRLRRHKLESAQAHLMLHLRVWLHVSHARVNFRLRAKCLAQQKRKDVKNHFLHLWRRDVRICRRLRHIISYKNHRILAEWVVPHWNGCMRIAHNKKREARRWCRLRQWEVLVAWHHHVRGVKALLKIVHRTARRWCRLRQWELLGAWHQHVREVKTLLEIANRIVQRWLQLRRWEVLGAWHCHSRQAKTLRTCAYDLGQRIQLRVLSVTFARWRQDMHLDRYYRLSCTRLAAHKLHQRRLSAFLTWQTSAAKQRLVRQVSRMVSAIESRKSFRRGALCHEAMHLMHSAFVKRQALHFKQAVVAKHCSRASLRSCFREWFWYRVHTDYLSKIQYELQIFCKRELRLRAYFEAWQTAPHPVAAFRTLARQILALWAHKHVIELVYFLKEASLDRQQRNAVLVHLVSQRLNAANNKLASRTCISWRCTIRQLVCVRTAHRKVVTRREKRWIGRGFDAFVSFARTTNSIANAVKRSVQCKKESCMATFLCEWAGICKRRQLQSRVHQQGMQAKLQFTWEVVKECLLHWQKACALRNVSGDALHGDVTAGVAFVRCIVGASENHGRKVPEWVVRRLCGFVDSRDQLVPDLVLSMDRYIRRSEREIPITHRRSEREIPIT
jgi:hypothetical protein